MEDLRFVGGDVLGPVGMHNDPLCMSDGMICAQGAGRDVDLSGYMVLPGIIDVHGDGFERHLAPRRGAMKEMAEGLIATETELAANGITTGVLAQFVSWEGGLRGLTFADQVFRAIKETAPKLVTDLRAQLRLETHLLDLYPDIPEKMMQWGVEYIVFNDHLPHARLAQGRQPPRMVGQALKAGRNPDVHFQMMMDLHAHSDDVPVALDGLCAQLSAQGIRMGSHDDAQKSIRDDWHERGAHIAEFPETLEAAKAAKAKGDLVVLGAPNVVRGGSHKGNASAVDLIALGLCDAIASDYHYPSPRRAALMLAKTGLASFADAWGLVSCGPAKVLGLEDRGVLSPGKRADLVILDRETRRVAATLVKGRISHMAGDVATRFFAA
ncbi:alpha-D-ribose 1-methylphosphonate 5-triphosphate diphosphatase [Roseobacter denitrificans]|nr:alpha-D-ribose 1-methylphosphonate 5-triphosphate diphosphatase [Roseobacter denitrificans]AVL52376.1 alpha-D-ribose 1-methylphosphonate 5-triphosphate diphosphatase [Roseobacter denitrificans]